VPGRRRRLGAECQRHRHPPACRHRLSAAACAWTSRACRSCTRPSCRSRSATSASPVSCSRRSAPPQRSGTSLAIPWYWNIAPNYDATFEPTYYSKRGSKLDTEFRYLTDLGRGTLETEYLPDDTEFGDSRSYLRFIDRSDFTDTLRLDVDAANVSDSAWFEDFGLGRKARASATSSARPVSRISRSTGSQVLRAQNFQTIDDVGIPPQLRPHTLLPALACTRGFPDQLAGLDVGLDLGSRRLRAQLRDLVTTGWRMDVAPEIRWPLRGAGVYLEPAAGWRYTRVSPRRRRAARHRRFADRSCAGAEPSTAA
jgi:LPS-assembly protein